MFGFLSRLITTLQDKSNITKDQNNEEINSKNSAKNENLKTALSAL